MAIKGNIQRPNFFLIGAHKAGTTSLYELFKAHPQIAMSRVKEPGFFSIPAHAARGLDWYESLFEGSQSKLAVGEASTTYSLCNAFPGTVDRLLRYSPDARIIYIVRHPLQRLESAWIQWRSEGQRIPKSFSEALHRYPALIDSARYWTQLNAYRDRIPDDRILVLFFEDFVCDPVECMQNCFRFLGVDLHVPIQNACESHNASLGKREDSVVLALLRRLPGYDRVRDILAPERLRQRLKSWLTTPIPGRPEWAPESLDVVRNALADELPRFLGHCGKRPDYWAGIDLEGIA